MRFSGTKYAKGNNNKNGNHYKCGENCSKIRGRTPRPPPRVRGIGARSAKYTGISGAPMSVFVYMSLLYQDIVDLTDVQFCPVSNRYRS